MGLGSLVLRSDTTFNEREHIGPGDYQQVAADEIENGAERRDSNSYESFASVSNAAHLSLVWISFSGRASG